MKAFFALFTIFLMIFATVHAVEKSACALPKDVGPCRKADLKFYYNDETKKCEEFFYGGCRGNDNRFQTEEECKKLCL